MPAKCATVNCPSDKKCKVKKGRAHCVNKKKNHKKKNGEKQKT